MSSSPGSQTQRHELGTLVAEFRDYRASVSVAVGYCIGAIGAVLLVGSLFALPPKALFNKNDIDLAIYLVLAGAVLVAVGKLFQRKRLAIYEQGITQTRWGKADSLLWRDVRQVRVEREARYGSGLAYRVRYCCRLERGDGTWLALDAVPITAEVMKALRKGAPFANLPCDGRT
jgi:hypothetical protein